MKFCVGTKNAAKIAATKSAVEFYFPDAILTAIEVPSGISDQPLSEDETFEGAANRAKAAFVDCDFSIGIESGLRPSKHALSGYFDFCVCALYDGKTMRFGTSSHFEYPKKLIDCVLNEGLEIKKAAEKVGLSESEHVASQEGNIGRLTKGAVTRQTYSEQALYTVLFQLVNQELYPPN